MDSATVIDAANYAVQTVTTVGFGDWTVPLAQPAPEKEDLNRRLLQMRGWSVVFMLFGASLYTTLTGVVVAIVLGRSS
jgi:hypothetical protein